MTNHDGDDGKAACCVACGAARVTTSLQQDTLTYGAIQPVELVVEVPVHHCGGCGLLWTDDVAEGLRDEAVRRYRAERHRP